MPGISRISGLPPLVAAKTRVPEVQALSRDRLHQRLASIWDHDLGLVIAPAGAGKTTLLAQFAARTTEPVAWYRAESSDGEERTVLAYLEFALGEALGGLDGQWRSVEDAARALEARSLQQPALLIVDDLHVLRGSPAESLLARFVDYAPPNLAVLAASRAAPGFDVSRIHVAGRLLEVRADDLRFRAWEVERLFRDVYRMRHTPEELAELARRTEGWAAGLQLFHLATRGRRADERRVVLSGLAARSRFVREYLASNVLGQLEPQLRRFLVDTCVLGRLTGPMCDRYLGREGSAEILAELARTQVFTVEVEHEGAYRYHEVLRSHLAAVLVDEVGETEARLRYARAGAVLEEAGAVHDALFAYCRGEDWHTVGRLLGHEGEQIARDPGEWLDLLPSGIRDHDPWVHLATARRWRAAGRWVKAVVAYRRAEQATEEGRAGDISRRERLALTAWLEPPLVRRPGWSGLLRESTVRDPLAVSRRAAAGTGPRNRLVAGLSALLAGHVTRARVMLAAVAQEAEASPSLSTGARLAAAAAALLAGDPGATEELGASAEDADALGIPWLARLARALADPGSEGPDREATGRSLDLEILCRGLGSLHGGAPAALEPAALDRAAAGFAKIGAGVAGAWCLAVRALALAREGDVAAVGAAQDAEARARSLAVPGAQAFAHRALAMCQPAHGEAHHAAAMALAGECGLQLPPLLRPVVAAASPRPSATGGAGGAGRPATRAVSLRCFGRFALRVDDGAVELGGVRPRVRSLLRYLSLHAGEAVHREVIAEALWPQSDPEASVRNLHVAVSTLRGVLPCVPQLAVERDGDAYGLALPAGAVVDVVEFGEALSTARSARAAEVAVGAYQQALAIHAGELLAEEGPADWVVGPRDRYRSAAADAAEALAALLFAQGDSAGGALACKQGLEIDRYQDGLWRILVEGLDAAGDAAAAAHARQLYGEVLAELGVSPPS